MKFFIIMYYKYIKYFSKLIYSIELDNELSYVVLIN